MVSPAVGCVSAKGEWYQLVRTLKQHANGARHVRRVFRGVDRTVCALFSGARCLVRAWDDK